MLNVAISKQATRFLKRLPVDRRTQIREKIRQLAADPTSLAGNVKRLRGERRSRLRVGDIRVIYAVRGTTLYVDDIGFRSNIYR